MVLSVGGAFQCQSSACSAKEKAARDRRWQGLGEAPLRGQLTNGPLAASEKPRWIEISVGFALIRQVGHIPMGDERCIGFPH